MSITSINNNSNVGVKTPPARNAELYDQHFPQLPPSPKSLNAAGPAHHTKFALSSKHPRDSPQTSNPGGAPTKEARRGAANDGSRNREPPPKLSLGDIAPKNGSGNTAQAPLDSDNPFVTPAPRTTYAGAVAPQTPTRPRTARMDMYTTPPTPAFFREVDADDLGTPTPAAPPKLHAVGGQPLLPAGGAPSAPISDHATTPPQSPAQSQASVSPLLIPIDTNGDHPMGSPLALGSVVSEGVSDGGPLPSRPTSPLPPSSALMTPQPSEGIDFDDFIPQICDTHAISEIQLPPAYDDDTRLDLRLCHLRDREGALIQPEGMSLARIHSALTREASEFWKERRDIGITYAFVTVISETPYSDEDACLDIQRVVAAHTDSPNVAVVIPEHSPRSLLRPLIVRNITDNAYVRLTSQLVWRTKVASFCAWRPYPFVPFHVISILRFQQPPTDLGEEVVRGAVQEVLSQSPHRTALEAFATIHADAFPLSWSPSAVTNAMIASVDVQSLSIGIRGARNPVPVFNLRMQSPTRSARAHDEMVNIIKAITFHGMAGSGRAKLEPFVCKCCHSTDHPDGLCPFRTSSTLASEPTLPPPPPPAHAPSGISATILAEDYHSPSPPSSNRDLRRPQGSGNTKKGKGGRGGKKPSTRGRK